MSRHDHPNPSASPVQKLRVRYAKRGRLRFTSHRDLARAFERSLRRAGIPMAQSQGFSPRPKVSWAGAVPTGVASEAEYVEMQLVERVDPEVLHAELDPVLPVGFDLLEVVEAAPGALADRLEASRWLMEIRGIDVGRLRDAVSKLVAADSVEVERMTKDGRRSLDARAALVSAEAHAGVEMVALSSQPASSVAHVDDWPKGSEPYGILETVVRQTTPVVRPDDVLSALRVVAGLAPSVAGKATRLEQGRLDDAGGLADPLAQDRAATGVRRGEPAAG
ncbi:TIGR03936 family radical SAM-associated protein [Parasphingorhabdus pacifica]